MILFFQSCASQSKAQNLNSLEGQEWVFERIMNKGGFGGGKRWRFFSENRFEYTTWYSGGAYWTHRYQGTYKYDNKEKKVFLKFNSNQNSMQDKLVQKMAVQLDISQNDTIPIITNFWEKTSDSSLVSEQEKVFKPLLFQKMKFKVKKNVDYKSTIK